MPNRVEPISRVQQTVTPQVGQKWWLIRVPALLVRVYILFGPLRWTVSFGKYALLVHGTPDPTLAVSTMAHVDHHRLSRDNDTEGATQALGGSRHICASSDWWSDPVYARAGTRNQQFLDLDT